MQSDEAWLEIRVVDARGRGVAGAAVTVAAPAATPEIAYLTGEDGGLVLRLPTGPITLDARAPGLAGRAEIALRPDGRDAQTVTIPMWGTSKES